MKATERERRKTRKDGMGREGKLRDRVLERAELERDVEWKLGEGNKKDGKGIDPGKKGGKGEGEG